MLKAVRGPLNVVLQRSVMETRRSLSRSSGLDFLPDAKLKLRRKTCASLMAGEA
jgi:hypothetical protein